MEEKKKERLDYLVDELGNIDDKYINEVLEHGARYTPKRRPVKAFILAAAVILALTLSVLAGAASIGSGQKDADNMISDVTHQEKYEQSSGDMSQSDDEPNQDEAYPLYRSFHFADHDELCKWFYLDREEQGFSEEYDSVTDDFLNLIDGVARGDIKLVRPYFKGEPFSVSSVALFSYEWFGRPWVWYHCTDGDGMWYSIKMMYLSKDEAEDLKDGSGSAAVRSISPDAPNIDNAEKFENYQSIYEEDLRLEDRTTKALVYKIKDNNRLNFIFVYDNVLVEVISEVPLSESFWRSFSVRS